MVILVEGRDEKVVQRYTTPLLVMAGEEYARMPFQELLEAIEQAMPWDRDIVGMSIGPDGERRLIRAAERREWFGRRRANDSHAG